MLKLFHVGSCVAEGDTWAINIWNWDDTSQMLTLKVRRQVLVIDG